MRFQHPIAVFACACLLLTGCHTMRPVEAQSAAAPGAPSAAAPFNIAVGDTVRVLLHDGRTLDLRVEAVDAQGFQGGGQRVAFSDVERVERNEINWTRTTLLLLGIAGLGVLGLAVFASHNLGLNFASKPVY